MAHQDKPVSVRDLSAAVGVSERTLHRAFVEHYGVGPKDYLRAVRLNAVRRELKQSVAQVTKVREIAMRFGFWHEGQFAADYRRLFGERPSETLRSRVG